MKHRSEFNSSGDLRKTNARTARRRWRQAIKQVLCRRYVNWKVLSNYVQERSDLLP